ncbi:MAG: signal peptidase I [Elusimicrobia bacterium]|nr:signal peptidase I [Elusimicrobiota bacterium]
MNFILFLIFSLAGIGSVGYVFFKMQEYPMEYRLGIVLVISIIDAIIFRKIRKKSKGFLKKAVEEAIEWADTLIWAGVFAFLIMYFFLQAFKIPSGSMRNTLLEGDHLFVNKFVYGTRLYYPDFSSGIKVNMKRVLVLKKPKRGDIVVFAAPPEALEPYEREAGIKKDFVKRCIGVAGDKIEVKKKKLYVNDVLQKEPYVIISDVYNDNIPQRDNFGPITVPTGNYFMMGDNRDNSKDSRFWGTLDEKYIKGKPLLIFWPPKRVKLIK